MATARALVRNNVLWWENYIQRKADVFERNQGGLIDIP